MSKVFRDMSKEKDDSETSDMSKVSSDDMSKEFSELVSWATIRESENLLTGARLLPRASPQQKRVAAAQPAHREAVATSDARTAPRRPVPVTRNTLSRSCACPPGLRLTRRTAGRAVAEMSHE